MEIKRNKIDLSAERKIIINCIADTEFLKSIMPILQVKLFQSSSSKIIMQWVKDFYKEYELAPEKNIESIFISQKKNLDEKDRDLIEQVLSSVSKEYEENQNTEYSLDQAEEYLKLQKLKRTYNKLGDFLVSGNLLQAESVISNFTRLERPTSGGLEFTTADFEDILNHHSEKLFSFPGDMGQLCGEFIRGDFFGIFAPPKRGKTFMLLLLALLAYRQKLNVIFFSFEMSEKAVMRRMAQMMLSAPRKELKHQLMAPTFTSDGGIDYDTCNQNILNLRDIKRKQNALKRSNKGRLKVKSFPTFSGTLDDLTAHLDILETYDNFIPDVIVADYADIIAPDKNAPRDYRQLLDYIWKRLRGIGQTRDCFLATGSQTNKQSMERDVKLGDVAEDMRKLAHITGGISLNQTDDEKKAGIMRVKPMLFREEEFFGYDEVTVLQSLAIGQPILDCRRSDKVDIKTDKGRKRGMR